MIKKSAFANLVRFLGLVALCVTHPVFADDSPKPRYPALPFSSDFGGPFALVDHSGEVVTDKDFLGQYVLLFFGYTNCADICVVALHRIGKALKRTEPLSNQITPLFIDLVPAKESLVPLKQYVQNFHPRFVGLTGSERALAMAAGAYGIRYRNIKNEDGTTAMIHSGKIFLIDPEGEVLTYLPHEASVDWMAEVIEETIGSASAS